MNEPMFNLMGFLVVPVTVGAIVITAISVARKQRPSFWRTSGILGGLAALSTFVFAFGWFCEIPYAYAFTLLLRIPNAKSASGVPISRVIKPTDGCWFTDGYIATAFGLPDNITIVELKPWLTDAVTYFFAYNSKTGVLVPATDSATIAFPSLVPRGDQLKDVAQLCGNGICAGFGGNNEIKLPAKWFLASIGTRSEGGQR